MTVLIGGVTGVRVEEVGVGDDAGAAFRGGPVHNAGDLREVKHVQSVAQLLSVIKSQRNPHLI